MRISDRLATLLTIQRVRDGRAALDRLRAEVSSGRRVSQPSDDPSAYQSSLGTQEALAQTQEHSANASRGMAMLDAASSALESAHDLLARARELVEMSASDTTTQEARNAAATELDQIRQSLGALRATESQGESVFVAAGHSRRIEVGRGVFIDSAVDGDAVFAGPVNLDSALSSLSTSLRAGDAAAARTGLDTLSSGLQQVENGIGQAGARRASMEIASNAAKQADVALHSQLSDAVSVDPTQAISQLVASEASLQAALQVGTRLLQPVLADKV
jgi:flagellar hook-associated protein 3 FlgL